MVNFTNKEMLCASLLRLVLPIMQNLLPFLHNFHVMKNYLVVAFSILLPTVAVGQSECNCLSELNFVIAFIEANAPSFQDNVNSTNQVEYNDLKKQVMMNAKTASNKVECFKALTYYVEFFKDNHTALYAHSEDVDEDNAASVQSFLKTDAYQSTEEFALGSQSSEQYSLEDIRGIYQTHDGRYTIAVVPDKGLYRDYVGVITASQSKLWKPNQIRLEIKKTSDGRLEVFEHQNDHSLKFYRDYPFVNGVLGDTWFKTSIQEKINPVSDISDSLVFRMIGDSVAYLRIPSFFVSQLKQIDSLVTAVDRKIKQTPYLVIDVRNNGGGSDRNALRLLDYIYTNPIEQDRVELFATEGNIEKYENIYREAQQDTANYGEGFRTWARNTIERMKSAPSNSYLLLSTEDQFIRNDSVLDTPRKVAVLYNKYCASSCETLLFWAMESDKTILVGENSGGYVGYGEALVIKTPCFGFNFPGSTTRYKNRRKYEVDGIPPDHQLRYDKDWLQQTIEILTDEGSTK